MGVDISDGYRNIVQPHLLLVEDDDAVGFFDALIKRWNLNDTTIWKIGRGDEFERNLRILKTDFVKDKLKTIGIVQDAKDNPTATFERIKSALAKLGDSVPDSYGHGSPGSPIIHIIILPDGLDSNGGMESLCLRALEGDPVLPCVDGYFECLSEHEVPYNGSEIDKAKILVYLASNDSIKNLRELASSDVLSLEDTVFEKIKLFLTSVCNV
jgi:hypothetical protein